jgi:hypothetical protein
MSLFTEVKWLRLESRVKESLKCLCLVLIHFQLVKKNKASTSTNKIQNIMDLNLFL